MSKLVHMSLQLLFPCGKAVLLTWAPTGVINLAVMCWENELQGAYLKKIQIHFCKQTVLLFYCITTSQKDAKLPKVER